MKLEKLNRSVIFYIALTSFLVVIAVQVIWLANTFRLKEKDFDEKVTNTIRLFNTDFQENKKLQNGMLAVWDNHKKFDDIKNLINYAIDTCFERNNLPGKYVIGVGLVKQNKVFWASDTTYRKQLNASKFSIIALCMDKLGAYQMKFYFPDKQGFILSSLTPLLLLSGFSFLILFLSFIGLIVMLKKQARLSQIKNDFINNMTHELKTPLFTVSIASRMLAETNHQPADKKQKYLNSIQQEVKRLNNLVEKILQTSLLEQKSLNLQKQTMDLHFAIKKAVEGFKLIQEENEGNIILQLHAVNHLVVADEIHVINSIYNLLDNAFKYADKKPEIIISTKNTSNAIILIIKDNGIGLDKETKAMVFERFYRAHTGNLHNVKGYGIGLSYVKSVVEAHDGIISVSSIKNSGSEFTVQLPVKPI